MLVAFGDVETTPYLVMEYVEGVRLSDWVDRAPIAPEEIARLGSALALALHDLHRQDVVHLDLKPTNVLYRSSGEAVLIDFGLAHHGHYPDLLAEEFRSPVGNWVYMAPEQVAGVRCDPRSDIFALGGHPVPARDRTASVRQSDHQRSTAAAALSRPGPASRARWRDTRLAAGDHSALPRGRRPQPVRVGGGGRLRSGKSRPGRDHRPWIARPPCQLGNADPPPAAGPEVRARAVPAAIDPIGPAPIVLVAIGPAQHDEALFEALRDAARRLIAADDPCRIACVTVVPLAAALSGEGHEYTATGRHIKQLVNLRRWAKPLELPEERLTYHVLESEKTGYRAHRLREDERRRSDTDRRTPRRRAGAPVPRRVLSSRCRGAVQRHRRTSTLASLKRFLRRTPDE